MARKHVILPSSVCNKNAVHYFKMQESFSHISRLHMSDGGTLHTYHCQNLKYSMEFFK